MIQKVQVRYYAQLREALKTSSEEISMDMPLTEKEILNQLANRHPKLRNLFFASRVAVDEGYVEATESLQHFSCIDIISPISGG